MIKIGITGQIGCGKSVVAAEFKRLGATVISGDDLGRKAVEENPQVLAALVSRFGQGILTKAGRLDRRRLAKIAFADPTKTKQLNAIVHPWLLRRLRSEIEGVRATRRTKILVVDAALIYNWRLERELDSVVVVESTFKNQRARLETIGLTEREIRDRIGRQVPKYIQRQRADFVLTNNGAKQELTAAAGRLFTRLLSMAESD